MITIALTNFNREQLLYESIDKVIDDPRISEVIISDDCSDYALYRRVVSYFDKWPKVKVSRTDTNIDCYRNKRRAVSLSSNEWLILLDSDNIIDQSYIDTVFTHVWTPKTIFQPEYARPSFDFRQYAGQTFNKKNVHKMIDHGNFATMLNAMNYFVNRDDYLSAWDGTVDPVTSDSIFQNYNMIKAGCEMYVVPGLYYEHRVHKGSHYQNNVRRTPKGFHDNIVQRIKNLR